MGTKRSGWITGVVVAQLLYGLLLLALPVYLLVLTRTLAVRNGANAGDEISGLRIAAAIVGSPAIVVLVAWIGLWKEKLWGWWLTVLADLGLVAIFMYSLIDDGWKNIDGEVATLTVIAMVPVIWLLLPKVRRFYWRSGEVQSVNP